VKGMSMKGIPASGVRPEGQGARCWFRSPFDARFSAGLPIKRSPRQFSFSIFQYTVQLPFHRRPRIVDIMGFHHGKIIPGEGRIVPVWKPGSTGSTRRSTIPARGTSEWPKSSNELPPPSSRPIASPSEYPRSPNVSSAHIDPLQMHHRTVRHPSSIRHNSMRCTPSS
jgi:hypothetical protein